MNYYCRYQSSGNIIVEACRPYVSNGGDGTKTVISLHSECFLSGTFAVRCLYLALRNQSMNGSTC